MYLGFLDLKQWVFHKFVPDEAVVDEDILAKSEPSANLAISCLFFVQSRSNTGLKKC